MPGNYKPTARAENGAPVAENADGGGAPGGSSPANEGHRNRGAGEPSMNTLTLLVIIIGSIIIGLAIGLRLKHRRK